MPRACATLIGPLTQGPGPRLHGECAGSLLRVTVHAVIVALSWERAGGVEVPTVAPETVYSPILGSRGASRRSWGADAPPRAYVRRDSRHAKVCGQLLS